MLFPNVLVMSVERFYYCIDICCSKFFWNIFIALTVHHSASHDLSEETHFCRPQSSKLFLR
jgi:hypothetical protein